MRLLIWFMMGVLISISLVDVGRMMEAWNGIREFSGWRFLESSLSLDRGE